MACFSILRGKCIRVTRLDECCTPPAAGTPRSVVLTKGFVTVGYSAEVSAGDDIELKNADGDLCVSDRTCDQFKYWNLELEFCEVDPDLVEMMAGLTLETDFNGDSVGFRTPEGQQCGNFALELWTGVPGGECDPANPNLTYGYVLLPCVTGGSIGDLTVENGASTFTVSAYTNGGQGWGQGPYAVVPTDAANTPGRLQTPMGQGEHMLLRTTTVAPPCLDDGADLCGAQDMPVHATT